VYLDVARTYTIGSSFSGEFKAGGKYLYRNRFKESAQLFSPYYLGYFQDYVRNPDGSISPKNFAGTRFANLQLIGRNVLFTNFLDVNPATRDLFGKYYLNPLLNRDALRDWYELNKNGVGLTGQSEYYNNPEVGGDYYDVIERNQAVYLMNTFNFGQLITLIAGVRVERESNDYTAKYVSTPLGGFPVTGFLLDTMATYEETEWLPNFHFDIRPTDYLTVRLAAYRAIARPDFNARLEKMVARVTNPRNLITIGNPRLKNAKSWNFEINSSVFSNTIGLFSVSAFYREITDMFHTVTGIQGNYNPGNPSSIMDTLGITWRLPFAAGSPISLTYATNSQRPTKVWGFEVEHQANLSFLPGLLSNIVLSYNFSFVRSETFVLADSIQTTYVIIGGIPFPRYTNRLYEAKQKLEGQPDFFGNLAVGYDLDGFSGRLSIFYQAEYNRQYSANRRSDPVERAFSRWDLTLKQRVTEYLSLFLNLNNLTNAQEEYYTVNREDNWQAPRSNQQYGLTGDLGVRLEF
jgi:TonB-dependent receptor